MRKVQTDPKRIAKRQELIKKAKEQEPTDEQVAKLKYISIDGHEYSPRNKFFLALQNVELGRLAGFRQWMKHGCKVKKGERGSDIMIPLIREDKDKKGKVLDTETFFKWIVLFHESQTEKI